jgi:protein-tyrosine phosphatase
VSGEPLDPPLRVDWIDADRFGDGRPGRLGLTFLPGKHGASLRYPGRVYRRELEADVTTLRALGLRRLLLLVEDHELERWGDPDIVERAAEAGLTVERWPMADGAPPETFEELDAILRSLREARTGGDVALACMGGVGRTGTVAACALVEAGWPPDEAIGFVRRTRHPTAVETDGQVAFVRDFAGRR